MKKILALIDKLSIVTGKLASGCLFLVAMIVIYEVFMRYVLHLPTLWVSEAMGMGCALFYFLGTAWILQAGRHVKIETVYERVSPRVRAILDAATFIFFILYVGIMARTATLFFWDSFLRRESSGSPWNPPVYPIKFVMAMGFFMLILQGSAKFIRDIFFAIKGREL